MEGGEGSSEIWRLSEQAHLLFTSNLESFCNSKSKMLGSLVGGHGQQCDQTKD